MSRTVVGRGVVKRAALLVASLASIGGAQSSTNDPRVGLKPGLNDAGEAAKNMVLVSHSPKADALNVSLAGLTYINSDLAFKGHYIYQGNFSGFQVWDVSNWAKPVLTHAEVCATDQGDPSIFGNLLFVSAESGRARIDCGTQGVQDTVSAERMRGVRIFDLADPAHPKQVGFVQNCRGSHTHTLIEDPKDKANVYVYFSGSAGVRSPNELKGCSNTPEDSASTSLFRIDIAKVPLAHPEESKIVNGARIFQGLGPRPAAHGNVPTPSDARQGVALPGGVANNASSNAPAGGRRGGGNGGPPPGGVNQCHDITLYKAAGYGAGACGGWGILLDIKDPLHPKRLDAAADTNFAFWHSATFNNDGTKVVFTDEWGGGTQPRCRSSDPIEWGGDAIFSIKNGKLVKGSYFKMPAAQTEKENCVAHNGGLVPVPGRDIMVQGWYQGGVDVFDFTDPAKPVEIAYFDRGPIDTAQLVVGGMWGAYYWNGHIIASELARGLDIFELKPSEFLTKNELDAANSVRNETLNPQDQPKIVWPATFALPRAYLDQLARNKGLAAAAITKANADLDAAQKATGAARATALNTAATTLEASAAKAADSKKVGLVVKAMRDLAKVK